MAIWPFSPLFHIIDLVLKLTFNGVGRKRVYEKVKPIKHHKQTCSSIGTYPNFRVTGSTLSLPPVAEPHTWLGAMVPPKFLVFFLKYKYIL